MGAALGGVELDYAVGGLVGLEGGGEVKEEALGGFVGEDDAGLEFEGFVLDSSEIEAEIDDHLGGGLRDAACVGVCGDQFRGVDGGGGGEGASLCCFLGHERLLSHKPPGVNRIV